MMMRRGGAGGGRIISMGGYFREHYLGASPLNYLGASPLNSLNLDGDMVLDVGLVLSLHS
jgi:hypothetical protein